MRWKILCDSTELAVECLHAAQAVGLRVEVEAVERWEEAARGRSEREGGIAVASARLPTLDSLVELAHGARYGKQPVVLALVAPGPDAERLRGVGGDLGLTVVDEVAALVAALALLAAGAADPWCGSPRALATKDRVRLEPVLAEVSRGGGHFVPAPDDGIAWSARRDGETTRLGHARDAAGALVALRHTDRSGLRVLSKVEGVDARAVTDVLFGPRRALSDPASKAALAPYGIPFPVEELCTSPSRAAAEASRIGFPVRIALASPDLRVWDHPELCVDMVDNAARAKETFRQLVALAAGKLAGNEGAIERRLLGVIVAATGEATAALWVRARPLPHGRVAADIGFADPHGRASADDTLAVLPAPVDAIERAVRRLRGSALLLPDAPARRQANLESLADVLLRLAAFVHDRREDVEWAELRPLALLPDGSSVVREACVHVSDAFERNLTGAPAAVNG